MPDKNRLLNTMLNPNGRIPDDDTPAVTTQPQPAVSVDIGDWSGLKGYMERTGRSLPDETPEEYAARVKRETGGDVYSNGVKIANEAVEGLELDSKGNITKSRQPGGEVTDPKDVGNFDDAISYLKGQADSISLETPEQRKARERRERRTMWLSHLADGLGSFHTAYSHAAGVQPMQLPNMSDKARAIYDRSMAKRQHDEERKLRYLQLMNTLEGQKRQNEYNNSLMAWRRDDLERKKVNDNLAIRKQDWLEKYQQGRLDIDKEKLDIEREYKAGLISKMERDAYSRELSAQAAYYKAQNGGSGSRGGRNGFDKTKYKQVIVRDGYGHETERYYVPIEENDNADASPGNNRSTSNNSNNSNNGGNRTDNQGGNRPPSRRNNNNNNNRPPSRR